MITITERDYQIEALDAIHEQFEQYKSTLLVLATGLGKTITFSQLARDYLEHGKIMVLAHREELITQAYRHLTNITGVEPDVEMADEHVNPYGIYASKIIVSTIQTQISGMRGAGRMTKFNPHEFSLLIIDEAHHSAAKSYRKVIKHYAQNPDIKILGVTATPDRADEEALGQIFDSVAYEYGIREGIGDGWLVPIEQQSVYVDGLDFSSVRTTAGDLNGADLARIMEFEETLHGIASPTIELAGDKRTLVFAASLAHAERLTEIFNRHKPHSARWVHGKTPKEERRELFRDYSRGEFQFLTNVGITTEGWDEPSVEVIVMARPTKSRSLYAQMVGRGTRTLPGTIDYCETADERKLRIQSSEKRCLDVIDFVGNAGRHKLVTSGDILGGNYSDEIVERAKENIEKKGAPADVISELELAEQQIKREHELAEERALRNKIKVRAVYSTAKINPFAVFNVEPWRERAWHKNRQPSEKQVSMLEKCGVDASGLSFTHASQLIQKIIDNRQKGLCTYKQAKVIRRFGYDPKETTFEGASKLIDAIANNGWRRPK